MDDEPSRLAPPEITPSGEAEAWTVLSYLISGPLLYGGLGWAADVWLNTGWLKVVGIVGGMVLAIYLIFHRYGRSPDPPPAEQGTRPSR